MVVLSAVIQIFHQILVLYFPMHGIVFYMYLTECCICLLQTVANRTAVKVPSVTTAKQTAKLSAAKTTAKNTLTIEMKATGKRKNRVCIFTGETCW